MRPHLASAAISCLFAAIFVAASVTAAHVQASQSSMGGLTATLLSHRRALRLVVEAEASYWFGKSKATSSFKLVPAKSLAKTKKEEEAGKEAEVQKEEQLHTDYLKDFDIELGKLMNLPELQSKGATVGANVMTHHTTSEKDMTVEGRSESKEYKADVASP